jgi:RNA polymerase sigma factor (sigma-70 family)
LGELIERMRRDAAVRAAGDTADAVLLERFARQHDEDAFAVLVCRHGPLVLGICRGVLRDVHDAEDAFQATFLVLVRKAGSIQPRAPLAHWLHGVAYRIAVRARKLAARRRARERPGVESVPAKACGGTEHEPRPALHDEINRLPDKYRAPVVLCYLQGKTNEEAARQLAWPVGTVKSRLTRARALLRGRLERRGLVLSAGLLTTAWPESASAAVPAALMKATLTAGLSVARGEATVAGAASASVAVLTQGALKSMLLSKLTFAGTVLVGIAVAGTATMAMTRSVPGEGAKDYQRGQPAQYLVQERAENLAVRGTPPEREKHELPGVPCHTGLVFGVAFSPDGKLLAVAGEDKTIKLVDMATRQVRRSMAGHSERVWSVAFDPRGSLLVSGSGEYRRPTEPGEVKLWDVTTGKETTWDAKTAEEKIWFRGHRELLFSVAYAPDGRTVASGSWDKTVKLWEVATGRELATFAGHQGEVRGVAYTPDSALLVSGSFDGTVKVWDVAAARERTSFEAHQNGVQCLAVSPDGKTLATADRPPHGTPGVTGEIKLWDLPAGKQRAVLQGRTSRVLALAFAPDGKTLASVGGDPDQFGEVTLWDVAAGRKLVSLPGHREWVECVAFSPDGKVLVSGGGHNRLGFGELKFWDLTTVPALKARK